jgi:hypothetical protein
MHLEVLKIDIKLCTRKWRKLGETNQLKTTKNQEEN